MKKIFLIIALMAALAVSACETAEDGWSIDEAEGANDDADGSADDESTWAGETDTQPVIVVHVCGEVNSPGVYTLPGGSRVTDAVDAAGGVTALAAADVLNLARILTDGEKIVVPSIEDAADDPYGTWEAENSGQDTASSALVNINTADEAELETLPGIGSVKAAAIVSYREACGKFTDIAEILNVSGIGSAIYAQIKDLITV